MSESIIPFNDNENLPIESDETALTKIADGLLYNTRTDLATHNTTHNTISMPIAELATLGAGVSSLLPAFRTITQTTTVNTSGLFQLANAAVGDTLKIAKNGNFWGAFKTADGASKFAQLQSAAPLTATSEAVAAIDPATIMMSVALFSIEQKLGEIEKMQHQIISFLETEKESEIEADVETLSNMISKYKLNWDNEHFITSNHKMVLDIQRTARKNMNGYQKKVSEILTSNKIIVTKSQAESTLNELLKKFQYYRLSLFTFSMASMMEIMLSGNFKEEYIDGIKAEIENLSSHYHDLFDQCSVCLEKISHRILGTNVVKGIGAASKAVGKVIGNIPVVKEGVVDEFLQDSGEHITTVAKNSENSIISDFAVMNNPETRVFVDKMDDFIQIYNHTKTICFDEKRVYLIA